MSNRAYILAIVRTLVLALAVVWAGVLWTVHEVRQQQIQTATAALVDSYCAKDQDCLIAMAINLAGNRPVKADVEVTDLR